MMVALIHWILALGQLGSSKYGLHVYCFHGCIAKYHHLIDGRKYALKMGMTNTQIDTTVLANDLERLFSGVLTADPQQILSSTPSRLK